MSDELAVIVDKYAITDVVNAVFDTVDAKDWTAARALFADEVDLDFTSLAGGDPVRLPADALVEGWIQGLHPLKQSFHAVSNIRVQLDGDSALVDTKGYAYNLLAEEVGGGLGGAKWEGWGAYRLALVRVAGAAWLVTALAFDAWHTVGDDAVRTHVQ
ncbi:nuclear transport factor 2 family protein [Yinghuangia soli]|uniref:Nuclear transport factor 2 family protein n=1 Tax=Yinghuangia soli TaxID=2908204 RepID=A0AA41PXS8_9ACTN|nr:nuclear transport factor 2 family protein [Yinghuangia soli]MCF2527843.1 nuclear transport factor 2 family protein [Yinghuangia soli]